MKTTKMSLANIQGKLSRAEMKNITAGSTGQCVGSVGTWTGSCSQADCAIYCSSGKCTCSK